MDEREDSRDIARGAAGGEETRVRVTLRVFGEDYPVKASADPEYLTGLAEYVDSAMRRVAAAQRGLGTGRIAVLAAMQIADELFRLKQEHETLTAIFEDEWAKRKKKA